MRKLLSIALLAIMVLAFAACNTQESAEPTVPDEFTQCSTQETPHIWDSVELRPPGSPSN